MIKLENFEVVGLQHAIRGMHNSMNSWDKSDSGICKGGDNGIGCDNCAACQCGHSFDHSFQVGCNDYELMTKLARAGPAHGEFRRMIAVYIDITAPLYWWKEFDTYKVGTVANSCSTMHKIYDKEFTLDDFSHEHLKNYQLSNLEKTIEVLNQSRNAYNSYKDAFAEEKKTCWWQMIQLLPSSYNQKRTVMLNYEVLADIYQYQKDHELDEWREFCLWIEELPNSDIITYFTTEV